MLLRFAVSNYLSFAERQEIALTATSLKDSRDGMLAFQSGQRTIDVLPLALVYGPNASGKSNLFLALRFMARSVHLSHRAGNPEGGVPRIPFALSKEVESSPTSLDVDFVVDGTRYHFGFECDDKSFTSEWLYAFPQGTRRKLYERLAPQEITFGPSLKGAKAVLKSMMRPNSLFLSVAAQNNHEQLGPIASFFNTIDFNGEIAVEAQKLMYEFADREIDDRTVGILSDLGTGIVGVEKHTSPVSEKEKELRAGIMGVLSKFAGQDVEMHPSGDQDTIIRFVHRGFDGAAVPFDMARESSGTRRLLVLLSSVFSALDKGTLVVIDELDASLHTHAAAALVALFKDPALNRNGAQLIATTHDTNLMIAESLRRDEIWFVEKDRRGASALYPLSEFQLRATDNVERGYMQGRFGALPFTGAVSNWVRARFGAENTRPSEEGRKTSTE